MPDSKNLGTKHPSYFLIAVSTRENLELCIQYGLAGFPSGENGAWSYCEIEQGDFVSFLYGARAHNLYRVSGKEAITNAEQLPPWKLLTFEESQKTYSFPFRLNLHLVRTFAEPIIRTEFYYVAENLLLRGGYRKSHFQADQTTLQSVSEMGESASATASPLSLPSYATFTLRFTKNKELLNAPETFRFRETILQSAIRRYLLTDGSLQVFLDNLGFSEVRASELEILGEKALTEGHIDLLLKHRVPLGSSTKIPIEVKTNRAQPEDLTQLRGYMDELRGECPLGVLVAADFSDRVIAKAPENGIKLVRYTLNTDLGKMASFEEIHQSLGLALEGR